MVVSGTGEWAPASGNFASSSAGGLSAIPCGFFGILFGEGFDATPEVASSSLIASTVLGIFTLAGWIVFLDRLH
jgi:predicted permease